MTTIRALSFKVMVTRGHLMRPDLTVAMPDSLPTVVTALEACVLDFIA